LLLLLDCENYWTPAEQMLADQGSRSEVFIKFFQTGKFPEHDKLAGNSKPTIASIANIRMLFARIAFPYTLNHDFNKEKSMSRQLLLASFATMLALCSFTHPANAADTTFYDDGPHQGQFPFSESVRVGDLLFLAGQVGDGKDGKLAEGGIEAEANQILLNISAALNRRGLTLKDVVKCTVFLADIAEWSGFNEVYKQHFKPPYPARSALGANGLALNARAEVECIAAF